MSTHEAHPHHAPARCQSCGMPLGKKKADHGTNADGTKHDDYCPNCFQLGAFTKPERTMDEALTEAVRVFTRVQNMDEDQAQVLARATIPTLKRWKHHHEPPAQPQS